MTKANIETHFMASIKAAGLLLILGSLFACHRFKTQYDLLPERCGSETAAFDGVWLKILESDGREPTPEALQRLWARFSQEGLGQAVDISASSRGCLKMPRARGALSIISPASGQAASRPFEPSQENYQEWRLKPMAPVETKLLCDPETVYTKQDLALRWSSPFPEFSEFYGLQISAIDSESKEAIELYAKDLHTETTTLPSILDLSKLKEGSYQLNAVYWDARTSLTPSSLLWNSGLSCPFYLKRSTPVVKAFNADVIRAKPGDAFLLQGEGQSDQSFACVEKRADLKHPESCAAQDRCKDPANFKEELFFKAGEAGHFRVLSYLVDKAGNRSESSCQNFSIADQAPKVWVEWEKPAWNRGEATFDKPYARVAANISVAHDLFSKEDLESRLECKVDFLLRGLDSLAGSGAVCASGRCAGKSLENYIPCDPRLEISLNKAWQQNGVSKSRMRVHVRVSDGAGHASENSVKVWINDSRWVVEELPLPPAPAEPAANASRAEKDRYYDLKVEKIARILPLEGRGLMLLGGSSKSLVWLWNGDQWIETPSLPERPIREIFLDGKKRIWAFTGQADGSMRDAFLRFDGTGWIEEKRDVPGETYFQGRDEQGNSFYWGAAGLIEVGEKGVFVHAIPKNTDGDSCYQTCRASAFRSENDVLRMAAAWGKPFGKSSHISLWENGAWKALDAFAIQPDESVASLLFDARGNLWALIRNEDRARIMYWSMDSGIATAASEFSVLDLFANDIQSDPEGRIILGTKYWDFERKEWLESYPEQFTNMPLAQGNDDLKTLGYVEKAGISLPQGQDLLMINKPFDLWVARYGEFRFIKDSQAEEYYWRGGGIMDKPVIYRYRQRRLVDVGSEFSGLPPMNDARAQDTKRITVSSDEGASFEYVDGTWRKLFGEWSSFLRGDEYAIFDDAVDAFRLIFTLTDDEGLDDADPRRSGAYEWSAANGAVKYEDSDRAGLMQDHVRDHLGNIWGVRSSSKEPVIALRRNKTSSFAVPKTDFAYTRSVFFSEDKAFALTDSDIFAKSLRGDDPFEKVNPKDFGLDLPENPENTQMTAYPLALQKTIFQRYVHAESASRFFLWDSAQMRTEELAKPPQEFAQVHESPIRMAPNGEIFGFSSSEVYRLKAGQWEIYVSEKELFDLRRESFIGIEQIRFDENNSLWIFTTGGRIFQLPYEIL